MMFKMIAIAKVELANKKPIPCARTLIAVTVAPPSLR